MSNTLSKYISPEWVWRGVVIAWFLLMTYMQSHFVTKDLFDKKMDKMTDSQESAHNTMIVMQKDMEIQSLKMTLISDHEGRIRALENKIEHITRDK